MVRSITLQGFKSFGAAQTIAFEPITVLVGPNNSGKSALMSLGRFVGNVAKYGFVTALAAEGGVAGLFHRPAAGPSPALQLSWVGDEGAYSTSLLLADGRLLGGEETLQHQGRPAPWRLEHSTKRFEGFGVPETLPMGGLERVSQETQLSSYRAPIKPLVSSRDVKLSLNALRQDSPPVAGEPVLSEDGAGLAQVLSLWRDAYPEKARPLDEFVRQCVPEISDVLVVPVAESVVTPGKPTQPALPGTKRLQVKQTDGERFDAQHVSDGALCFIALAMHAIDAPAGSVLFIEEPEQSIHRRRIHQLVELFRQVAKRGCQIVLATHSRILLDEFREQPEAIRIFRRSPSGSQVRPLLELPHLAEALRRQTPGELLETDIFESAFEQLERQPQGSPP